VEIDTRAIVHGESMVTSRGICSRCGQHMLPGEAVMLDAKSYELSRQGSDWRWHHAECDRAGWKAVAQARSR
jgi:hypothetical protein